MQKAVIKEDGEIEYSPLSQEEIEEFAKNDRDRLAAITYADRRRAEYPSFEQQMDILYHEGYDGWKTVITAIKEKYPKE